MLTLRKKKHNDVQIKQETNKKVIKETIREW